MLTSEAKHLTDSLETLLNSDVRFPGQDYELGDENIFLVKLTEVNVLFSALRNIFEKKFKEKFKYINRNPNHPTLVKLRLNKDFGKNISLRCI